MAGRADITALLERESYKHAFICTFTFEPSFFEDFCLEHFRSLGESTAITVITDSRIYASLAALDPHQRPRLANLRYLMHPVHVRGVFHPKLFLFASKDKGLLLIGSGNFTRSGLGANAELVGVYRYQRNKRTEHRPLFQQALLFLQGIASRWANDDLGERLAELVGEADWLFSPEAAQDDAPRLIHNLEESLWDVLRRNLPKEIREVHVLSRYFDAQPHVLDRLFSEANPARLVLWTENELTTMTPAWFDLPRAYRKRVEVRTVSIADGDYHQPLHAKAIAFVTTKTTRLAFGSANFSEPGVFSAADAGNLEIAIVADAETFGPADVRKLFDPQNVSRVLKQVSDLRTGVDEPVPESERTLIHLLEATLDEEVFTCRAAGIPEQPGGALLSAALEFADGYASDVPLTSRGSWFEARLASPLTRRCSEGTATVTLELREPNGSTRKSNKLFLANLVDVETGGTGRLQRRVRTAQRGAAQFVAVLADLLEQGETDQLKAFLTHCDIPLVLASRFRLPHARGPWIPPDRWRGVGPRHLRDYETLHDAVVGFVERHLARLQRHCEKATLGGLSNFMHIALAIVSTLRAQTERALQGLESVADSMEPDVWFNLRKNLQQYLLIIEEVLTTMVDGYFMALARHHKSAIGEPSLTADKAAFLEQIRYALSVRQRLLAAVGTRLAVVTRDGKKVSPPFEKWDLLGAPKWKQWEQRVRPLVNRLEQIAV